MNNNTNVPDGGEKAAQDTAGDDALAEALAEAICAPENPNEAEPDLLEVLSAENVELNDKVLRLAADMENLRRRAEREKAEATLYAASQFARDMLGVSDNMDRALETVSPEQREAADAVTRNLLQGVDMVQRELLNTFERHGIKRINPLDERFDPNLHQAMFEVPDETRPNGTVVQVVQPGFVIGERVLRPAMVGVAKGGPKTVREAVPADDEGVAANDGEAAAS